MSESPDSLGPVQARVYRRLGLIGAGPAAFFRDACRLVVSADRLATTTHLVGHLLREVEANLLDVLYEQLVAPLPGVTSLPPNDLVPPKSAPPPTQDASGASGEVSADAADKAGEDGAPKDGHRKKVRAILAALGLPLDGFEARQWLAMAGGKKRLHRVAHRNKLNPPRPVTPTFIAEFEAVVQLFDAVLERFESRYVSVYERLDALIARSTPGSDGIALLSEAIPNTPRTISYFFERLAFVGWLEPLRRAGFFRAAPPPDVDADRGTSAFPHWTAADYLAKVAASCPDTVASIVDEASSTENVLAQAQMVDLMLLLRAEDRVRLAPHVRRWIPGLASHHWGDQASAFATKLAQDGSLDLAFQMAAAVLDLPEPDPEIGRRPVRTAEYRGDGHQAAWHLRQAATTLVPTLLQVDGLRALALFAEALDFHVGRHPEEADADPATPEGLADFSTLWADDLGGREAERAEDLRVYLTHVTLEAVCELGARMPERLAEIVGILRQRGARVLRRIELAALAALASSEEASVIAAVLPLAIDRLTTRSLIVEDELSAEWSALLAAAFPRIEPEERTRVLGALEPPDFSWMQNAEYAARRAAAWRRDRLAAIANHLDPAASAELSALTEAEGAPELLRAPGPRVATFTGPGSPLDEAALRAMDANALVAFLQKWEPRRGFAEPSPEGLGRQLAKLIEANPEQYALWAGRFIGLAPTYVRSFFDGLVAAIRADRVFPWTDVLSLAWWVVRQPVPESDMEPSSFDADADWRNTRRTLADLIGLGLGCDAAAPGGIPASERGRLWELIELLAKDVNPSPEYEARYGGTNMDPATLAINTTRPEAIDAAIRYGYWVAAHGNRPSAEVRDVLTNAPEVAALLERHLDPVNDPSLAVRAAIGRLLGSLARTDGGWVRDHLSVLLPDIPEEHARRDALWDAYLQWTQPHPDALGVLETHYRRSVDRTGADRGTRFLGEKPDDRLAEHLMMLYWWGELALDGTDNLVPYFFTRADAKRREHAIHYVGFSLYHSEKPIPVEPLERLRRLWEWRFPSLASMARDPAGRASEAARSARAELEQFGWWFASAAFEEEWALQQLHAVLSITGAVELDHAVAERLAETSPERARDAVRCLAQIDLTGGVEPWTVDTWMEHAPTVLRRALTSEDPAVRQDATLLINRIVAAGHVEFRSLLSE